ncbi:MAG: hypothetical protein RPS47_10050 [Colwellia sp.]|jgi:hypothetical protein
MRSRRALKKRNQDRKGMLFIFSLVAALSVAGFFAFELKAKQVERDDVSMCRSDGYISKDTVILMDATDLLTSTQVLVVNKKISGLLESALIDERFTLYVLDDNPSGFKYSSRACNPGDGKDKSDLTSNKRRLLKKWTEGFYGKITGEIKKVVSKSHSDTSPILEMIKFSSIDTLMDSKALKKRVIIISDLLHHTREYSHYKDGVNYENFKSSPYYYAVKPYLENVEVEILYIAREGLSNLQNLGHIGFWERQVQFSGGQVVKAESIY